MQTPALEKPALTACETLLAMKAPDAEASGNEEAALLMLLLPSLSKLTPGEPELAERLATMAKDLLASHPFGNPPYRVRLLCAYEPERLDGISPSRFRYAALAL